MVSYILLQLHKIIRVLKLLKKNVLLQLQNIISLLQY